MTKNILMLAYDDKTFHGIQERFAMDGIKVFHVDSKEEAVWKIQVHNYCMLILDTPFLNETEMKNIAVFREMSCVME